MKKGLYVSKEFIVGIMKVEKDGDTVIEVKNRQTNEVVLTLIGKDADELLKMTETYVNKLKIESK